MKHKTIALLMIVASCAISCTKGGTTSTTTSSGYTCSCIIYWNNGANQKTQDYPYGSISNSSATDSCNQRLKLLQLTYGTTSAGGQWVTCSLK